VAYIVVVDHNVGMRAWPAEILEGGRHEVVTAQDGLEARILTRQHEVDVWITDISMSSGDGVGLIHKLREENCKTKIVAICGKDAPVMDATLLGADAILRMPVKAETLLQCICELSPTVKLEPSTVY